MPQGNNLCGEIGGQACHSLTRVSTRELRENQVKRPLKLRHSHVLLLPASMQNPLAIACSQAAAEKRRKKTARAEQGRRNLQGRGGSNKANWGQIPGAYECQALGIHVPPAFVEELPSTRSRSQDPAKKRRGATERVRRAFRSRLGHPRGMSQCEAAARMYLQAPDRQDVLVCLVPGLSDVGVVGLLAAATLLEYVAVFNNQACRHELRDERYLSHVVRDALPF